MRKKIKDFIASCNGKTTIAELQEVCASEKELKEILKAYSKKNNGKQDKDYELSCELKETVLKAFENVPKEEITCLNIQKKLQVGYGIAWRLKDWLLHTK